MAGKAEEEGKAQDLPSVNVIPSDGSFMENFLKEQEEQKQRERSQEKASTVEEEGGSNAKSKDDPSTSKNDTGNAKPLPDEGKAKPVIIPKKTGILLRNKPIVAVRPKSDGSASTGKRQKNEDASSGSAYLEAMKKFKSQACTDDAASSRPLLK
uniref:Uncharacterized protein n=1 Tax=Pyramimonas obovata TaxID=1411642 RepID=A0A7S0N7W3_9CHLO|mmetsp:Transcript_20212/g.44271  ORF Transcript_20212/g.44271 Transcript_20212/m.44271 type:complete len:154 (+) Transcript_20212:137-598(+)|eukprot:CAMPEP_0118927244 /NCGR_PEP_ID=MMETSP1169-20130426/4758_1 /TAXON_ID=36882 /ORGANISM="Pyramimonas obovata, Strain CCMP722" /LENGTH=153 /DNA_ID=CAMNT_0006868975 /DNA_START=125 /DNA_END=586 /DNA_ORIENTATION=-